MPTQQDEIDALLARRLQTAGALDEDTLSHQLEEVRRGTLGDYGVVRELARLG